MWKCGSARESRLASISRIYIFLRLRALCTTQYRPQTLFRKATSYKVTLRQQDDDSPTTATSRNHFRQTNDYFAAGVYGQDRRWLHGRWGIPHRAISMRPCAHCTVIPLELIYRRGCSDADVHFRPWDGGCEVGGGELVKKWGSGFSLVHSFFVKGDSYSELHMRR